MEISTIPLASLVIVSWNSAEHLPHCLDSLASQTLQDFEVIIVDNGSTDHGIEGLEKKYPQLHLRIERLTSNLGFAAGNNLGAHIARGNWLILLNADAFPEPNWLEELILASRSHPGMGSFSSRQLQVSDPKILDGAGDAYHTSGMAWRRGIGYPSEKYGLEDGEIFSPCAAAAMYLRKAFLEVDGFDEDFFSYFEDVDLGFRLQLHGYPCLYVSKAVVHHVGSSTFGLRSDFALYHTHRNMIWTFTKNMPSPLFWLCLPAHLVLNIVYLILYTLRGRGKVIWQAKWDAAKSLSRFITKRQKNNGVCKVKLSDLTRVMEQGFLKPYLINYRLRQAWYQPEHHIDKK